MNNCIIWLLICTYCFCQLCSWAFTSDKWHTGRDFQCCRQRCCPERSSTPPWHRSSLTPPGSSDPKGSCCNIACSGFSHLETFSLPMMRMITFPPPVFEVVVILVVAILYTSMMIMIMIHDDDHIKDFPPAVDPGLKKRSSHSRTPACALWGSLVANMIKYFS